MTDKLTPQKRSRNMRRIRSVDTKPEIILRSVLHRMGFRFRVNHRGLPGRPDIVLPKYHSVVFVQGCFWHQHSGCLDAVRPKSNVAYWTAKLDGNVNRDRKNYQILQCQGWRVFRYWECEIEKDPISVAIRLAEKLRGVEKKSEQYPLPTRNKLLRAAELRAGYSKKR